VKSKRDKVIRELPFRYGKEFAEGWGEMEFRATSGSISN